MKEPMVLGWKIWSNEHRSWWKPNGCGYTKSRIEAGLYTFDEASQICASANAYVAHDQEPKETMLPYSHP